MLYSVDKVSTHVDIASVSVDIRSYDAAAAECRERPRAGSHTLRDASQDARRAIDRFPELGKNVPRSTVLVDASTTRVRGSVKRHCKGLTGRMKAPSVASNASTRLRYQISPRAFASGDRLRYLRLDRATLHGIGSLAHSNEL